MDGELSDVRSIRTDRVSPTMSKREGRGGKQGEFGSHLRKDGEEEEGRAEGSSDAAKAKAHPKDGHPERRRGALIDFQA